MFHKHLNISDEYSITLDTPVAYGLYDDLMTVVRGIVVGVNEHNAHTSTKWVVELMYTNVNTYTLFIDADNILAVTRIHPE